MSKRRNNIFYTPKPPPENLSETFSNEEDIQPPIVNPAINPPVIPSVNLLNVKDVSQYVKHAEIANNCNTALTPRKWHVFNNPDTRVQDHEVFLYDHLEARYRVTSRMETNDDSGDDYTVEYFRKKMHVSKWQTD
ncbi:hypothetical protein E3N88_38239 [Mikania micrantha]|uniref:Uncharacterized protein n=1 Tax=Mikania micrantha TaxID=192012 RepID=A0A5N6LVY5_9ASTR|nr:hypothetical protein E3N88_38239 [Mikania micrantha]